MRSLFNIGNEFAKAPPVLTVAPKPGFCIKTKNEKGDKVFINVCTGENLPVPKEISDEELLELLDSEDPSGFRIPMSLGEPHAEVDKSGQGCTAYDVVVNPEFFKRMNNSEVMLGFFLTVTLEGLEYKYDMTLSREWKMMKNRKFIGSLPEQNVRKESKPLIMDMEGQTSNNIQKPLITEIESKEAQRQAPEPPYQIVQEPPEGFPEFLVAEFHMPKVKNAASFTLDIGEDRILLQTRANIYYLDIYLPYNLISEECGAQFNRKTKILTLTMPVKV